MKWSFRLVTHTICLIILVSIADIALLTALAVQPISENAAWEMACWIAETFWEYMQRHWEDTIHAADCLTFTGDNLPHGESAFVISNHQAYSDYYLVQALARRKGMLGRCRYFVKKEIVRLPFFGWAFWAIGMILVSRDWTSDASLIENAFARVKKNGHSCWIILYPEGTRLSPKKIIRSQAYAKEHGKPGYRHLLFPRTKGFISTVQALQDSHIRYLYDLTFLYSAPGSVSFRAPSLDDQLSCSDLAKAGYTFQVHVRRIPLVDLPRDCEGLKDWCERAWGAKDDWLDRAMRKDEKSDL